MFNKQSIIVLISVLIGSIILAGCISQLGTGNQTTNLSGTIPSSSIASPGTPCVPSENTTPYIIINPIGTHTVGDVFEITGTTNLGVDKKLKIAVDEKRLTGVGPYDMPDWNYTYTDSEGYVSMNGGDRGINSWSYQVNLTGFHGSKLYSVNVKSEQNRTTINYTTFFVSREE